MALDDVPIKATSEEHASLKVHKVSDRELTEVRAVQCLLDGGHGVGVLVMSHDCEAYPRCERRFDSILSSLAKGQESVR